jgi:hypothetical protein
MSAPMAPDAGSDTRDGLHQMHRLHPHAISPRISDRSSPKAAVLGEKIMKAIIYGVALGLAPGTTAIAVGC